MAELDDLAADIGARSIEVVDLTAPLHAGTPVMQLPAEFGQTWSFQLEEISSYDDRGPDWYWNNIRTGEHTGTHFDAPVHWVNGRDKDDVSQVSPQRLVGPAKVIDKTSEVEEDPDYLLTVGDIQAWEAQHGPLGECWLLFRTGWSRRGDDPIAFANADENGPHTPGVSADAVRYLAASSIIGLGVETVGTDAGQAFALDPPHPCHSIALGAEKYGITQLRTLDRLPTTGAVVIVAPLPIINGSGSPCRVLALVSTS